MKSALRRLGGFSFAVLLGTLAWPVQAQAATVGCGRVVRSSLKLRADIGPCPGDGLVIVKNDVEVDLNGHTISGDGQPGDKVGIRLSNVTGVEVSNGTVTGFNSGVAVEQGGHNTVKKIKALNNRGTGDSNHGDGIVVDESNNNRIAQNEMAGNGPFAGLTLTDGSSSDVIVNNNIHDNTVVRTQPEGVPPWNPPPLQEDSGVRLEVSASNNTIDGNQIVRNGNAGIVAPAFDHTGMVVTNNVISGNGRAGIFFLGSDAVIRGNTIEANGFDDFQVAGAPKSAYDGVQLSGGFGQGPTTVEDNTIKGNAHDGVEFIYNGFTYNGAYTAPTVNVIKGNTVTDNKHNGIFIMCDFVANEFPNHVCLSQEEEAQHPHTGQQVIGNHTGGNGGADAGTSAWDLYDENPGCDSDTWLDNTYQTANPACTTAQS